MIKNGPLIGIVIVNYNGYEYQNECIRSILDSTYQNYYIIVVDNGSKDNSMERLDEILDHRIIKIFNGENLGVAAGNNIGIKKSIELGTQYTLLLNNDTVINCDCIEQLAKACMEDSVVVPKIYFHNSSKIWYAGGRFVKYKCITKHINYLKKDTDLRSEKYYEYAPTCCMLINNNIFDFVGLMDEKYFLYFDDTDFCMRLKLKGIKISFCSQAIVYHKVSMSSGGANSKVCVYYENRNRYYFYNKYKKYFPYISFIYFDITRKIRYILGKIKNTNDKYIKKSISDYKKGIMGRCDDL